MRMDLKLPQMTESAYVAVREAFRRALPAKVTATWVMANVNGYKAEASAKSLVRYLTTFGLLDGEGSTTDLAKKWRMDETYASACETMLRLAFPADIVDSAPRDSSAEILTNLFMNRGLGEGSAKNLARIYKLIASQVPPDAKKPRSATSDGNGGSPRSKPRVKTASASGALTMTATASGEVVPATPESGIAVLRYFLDRGRMAEIRVPRDMDERERRRLFAHLKIDLLDEVDQ